LAGLVIDKVFLMHINGEYVRSGDIDPNKLFTQEDITSEVDKFLIANNISELITEMLKVMVQPIEPTVSISANCKTPYICPFIDVCWKHLPVNNVFDLSRGGKKSYDLYNRGILELANIPSDIKLTGNQKIQVYCAKSGLEYINIKGIREFLDSLVFPISFLDFETYSSAIPMFDGMKPFQQISFQYALSVIQSWQDSGQRFDFLEKEKKNPLEGFIKSLISNMPETGSVVVYNQSFEAGRLKEISDTYSQYKSWVDDITSRMVDLLVPLQKFYYYNSSQAGSVSLKKTMPALAGIKYDSLAINEGGFASAMYFKSIFEDTMTESEKTQLYNNLLEYCGQDTMGMIPMILKLKVLAMGNTGG